MEKPNYTQTPNYILDNMAELSDAELRVMLAICRKTIGYHKDSDQIAHSQLIKMTGLSVNGVKAARDSLTQKGLITWSSKGKGKGIKTVYDLNISDTNISPSDIKKDVNMSVSDIKTPSNISPSDTTKEIIQRNKKRNTASTDALKPSTSETLPEKQSKADSLHHRTIDFISVVYLRMHGKPLAIDGKEAKAVKTMIQRATLEDPDAPAKALESRLRICVRKMESAESEYWTEFKFSPAKILSRWNELADDMPKQSRDERNDKDRQMRIAQMQQERPTETAEQKSKRELLAFIDEGLEEVGALS